MYHFAVRDQRGYVDDPRNTDNAWIETVCPLSLPTHSLSCSPFSCKVVVNFHDERGDLDSWVFEAGDDANAVRHVSCTLISGPMALNGASA